MLILQKLQPQPSFLALFTQVPRSRVFSEVRALGVAVPVRDYRDPARSINA